MRIILLVLLITSSVYSEDSSFLLKGGFNYSILKKGDFHENQEAVDVSYKFGEVLYLSWEKSLFNIDRLYINIDIGLNKKAVNINLYNDVFRYNNRYYWAIETPIILAYEFFDNFKLYAGVYLSQVFYKGSKDNFKAGFKVLNESNDLMYDKGFLFGVEYQHNNFLFNFRYQEGINAINLGDINNENSYNKNSQFIFMIGHKFN
jgi:hypothetical protein